MTSISTPSPCAVPLAQHRISLNIIVQNDELSLGACLESVKDLVQEVVIVDIGSRDRTKEVAARYGAKVIDHAWDNSFAAARNTCLRHSTGDWILQFDVNNRFDDSNRVKLKELISRLSQENVAYSLKCVHLPLKKTEPAAVVDQVRLFRNLPDLKWKYRTLEQIWESLKSLGASIEHTDIALQRLPEDPGMRGFNLQRDLNLLTLELEDDPDAPFPHFNLGFVYYELGQLEAALRHWQRSLELSHPGDSIVRKLYPIIAKAQWQLGHESAAKATCRDGLVRFPNDIELNALASSYLLDDADFKAAEQRLKQGIERGESGTFACVDTDVVARMQCQLALLYRSVGRTEDAEVQWKGALASHAGFLLAFEGLGDLYLRQERWADLRELLAQMASYPDARLEAGLLAGCMASVKGDKSGARRILEETAARFPDELRPRVYVSRAILCEGKDQTAAEKALREVLRLDPKNQEALEKLEKLPKLMDRRVSPYPWVGFLRR